jgi:RNA polymerase sigma-70 factor (ECF subfamily)
LHFIQIIGSNHLTFGIIWYQKGKTTGLMAETSDSTILELCKNPSSRDIGFTLLMDKYKKPVYWHIRRLVYSHDDAEDILQETFIQVYRHASSFRGDSKIFTWLYRIATNECTRYFRKNKTKKNLSQSLNHEISEDISETDAEDSQAIILKFQRAVLQLPEKQRIVFNLRYYDEISYEDMAQILNSSVNTLKTNYHYASEKIKKYMIDHA